jgi:ABC-type transporter MlaC component
MLKSILFFLCVLPNLISAETTADKDDKINLSEQKKNEDLEVIEARKYLINFLKKINKIAKTIDNNNAAVIEFAQHMLQSLNEKEMGKFILGPSFKELSAEEKKIFEEELTYFFTTYGSKKNVDLFASVQMEEEKFNFKEDINKDKGRFSFEKEFKTKDKPVKVKMVVLKDTSNTYQIFDIVIEDLSLLITTRDYIKNLRSNARDVKTFLKDFKEKTDEYLIKILSDFSNPEKLKKSLEEIAFSSSHQ